MALKLSPAEGALKPVVVVAADGQERQFVVRPRGSDRVFLVRRVPEFPDGAPRVSGCPTFCAVKADGAVVFYPEPSAEYPVFELVAVVDGARQA